MRRKIRRQGVAVSKHVGSEVTDNLFGDTRSDTGKRRRRAGKGRITIDTGLSRNFSLVIKPPGHFTAHLPVLTRRFPAYRTTPSAPWTHRRARREFAKTTLSNYG